MKNQRHTSSNTPNKRAASASSAKRGAAHRAASTNRVGNAGVPQRRKPSARPGKLDAPVAGKPQAQELRAKKQQAQKAGKQAAKRGVLNACDKRGAEASRAGKAGTVRGANPNHGRKTKGGSQACGFGGRAYRGGASRRAAKPALYCPIDAKCGGCQLLAIPYAEQLHEKQQRMERLFASLLDERTTVHDIRGAADPLHYRNKVVSPFVGVYDKRARRERILCGMYEQGTHRVIDSGECLIENVEAKRIILTIRSLMERFGMRPYDEDADTGFMRHAQVRVGHTSGEVMVTLVTRDEQFPAAKSFVRALKKAHPSITTVVQNVNTRQTNVIMGDKERTLYGPGFILDTLCGLSFRISSKSFYQVSAGQTEVLYRRAVQMARLTGGETLMDAYCGTGTIGLVAAKGVDGLPGAACVIGVEERPDAVADARNNARHNGIEAAEFVAADAGAFMRERAAGGGTLDVLMMDPPRAGSTPDFLKAACVLAPKRIVYISCNPDTQERDAAYLVGHGYRITEMQPVDMFPHTPHVENILAFERKDA